MLKKNEPDWIEHDGSSECPVPWDNDVEVRYDWGITFRCDDPEFCCWSIITHYRDWTAFEQQQASAGEVPKLLTWAEADARLIAEGYHDEPKRWHAISAMQTLGLIAEERDPLEVEAERIIEETYASAGMGAFDLALAALKRGMELARVTAPAREEG